MSLSTGNNADKSQTERDVPTLFLPQTPQAQTREETGFRLFIYVTFLKPVGPAGDQEFLFQGRLESIKGQSEDSRETQWFALQL